MSSTAYKIGPSIDIAAAWLYVEPILAAKQRGQDLTRSEIARVTEPTVSVRRLEHRIHQFFRRQGIHLRPLVGIGWHICTAGEQAVERTEHRRRRARFEQRMELHAAMTAPDTQLTAEERRHKELHIRAASTAIAADKLVSHERKAILGAPESRPRLVPSPKKEGAA
jgi:hypothetical protein